MKQQNLSKQLICSGIVVHLEQDVVTIDVRPKSLHCQGCRCQPFIFFRKSTVQSWQFSVKNKTPLKIGAQVSVHLPVKLSWLTALLYGVPLLTMLSGGGLMAWFGLKLQWSVIWLDIGILLGGIIGLGMGGLYVRHRLGNVLKLRLNSISAEHISSLI